MLLTAITFSLERSFSISKAYIFYNMISYVGDYRDRILHMLVTIQWYNNSGKEDLLTGFG